jgi:uncharacterized membrane protein
MNPNPAPSSGHAHPKPRDHAIERLEYLTDGVYAIALTLLALDLRLPDAALHASGPELLASLVSTWPKVLSYVTSFTVVALFWSVNHRMFHYIVRFDGRLRWLVLLQLGLVALVPFPSAVLGDHLNDPVAQEFYFGTLTLTLLVSGAGFWYASWNRRLITSSLSERTVSYYRILSLSSFLGFVVLLIAIPIGLANLVNPLILGYVLAFVIVALGLLDRLDPSDQARESSDGETWSH